MRGTWLAVVLTGIIFLNTGCGIGKATREDKFLNEYFQNRVGYKYHFEGRGSKFAAMDWEVVYKEGDRVQIVETSHGTRAALVYKIGRDSLELVHFDETSPYRNHLRDRNNQHQVLLHTPLDTDTRWEDRHTVREIVSLGEEIQLPLGKYQTLKVKKQYKDLDATEYIYYVKGLGFVKSEYISNGVSVITQLESIVPP